MSRPRGRPDKYYSNIQPHLREIEKYLRLGYSEADLSEKYGVAENSWISYKRTHPEFGALVVKSKQEPKLMLKSAILEKALGTKTKETKTIYDKDGNIVQVIETEKVLAPDLHACEFLLMNWAKEEKWCNDPQALRMREEELELKRQQQTNEDW